jgi:hypothetical protein
MDFIVRVGGSAPNGTIIPAPTATFGSTNNTGPYTPTPASGPFGTGPDAVELYGTSPLTVSAAPRWMVRKSYYVINNSTPFIPQSGPNGEDGYVAGFNIGVYAKGSRKGLEALASPYTIADSITSLDLPDARLVTWDIVVPEFANLPMGPGAEFGQQNGCGDWRAQLAGPRADFDNGFARPRDYGTSNTTVTNRVTRGGTCEATSVDIVNKTADLEITGTDFSLTQFPLTLGTGGAPLINTANPDADDNEWWVASKSVLIWVPKSNLQEGEERILTNTAELNDAVSVTGQSNPDSSEDADASYILDSSLTLNKEYTTDAYWTPESIAAKGHELASCDPTVAGSCAVNQAYPGQMVLASLNMTVRAASVGKGVLCEKIDNARFTLADLSGAVPMGTSLLDPNTGFVSSTTAGPPPALTFELGVGGAGITGGTWATRSNVTSEYSNPSISTGDQANATCGDSDATWYPSIAALETAGHALAEVTRVRAIHDAVQAGSIFSFAIPLVVNQSYAYSATEVNGTTPTITVGNPTLGSYAPNQSRWTSDLLLFRSSEALHITSTEYARVTKSALPPYDINDGQIMRGAVIDYQLRINLTSTTDDHITPTVTVWDVLPRYLAYIPGSARLAGNPLADPVCEAPGATPASGPFVPGSVPPGYQACYWTLTDQPVVKAAAGATAGDQLLTFQAIVDVNAPAGQSLLNSAFVDSAGNLMRDPQYQNPPVAGGAGRFECVNLAVTSCSIGEYELNVSASTGITLNKAVSAGNVSASTGQGVNISYDITYTAVGTNLTGLRLLDVLPYPGDPRGSGYSGTLQLTGPILPPAADAGPPVLTADPDMVVRYTSNAPGNIALAPHSVTHNTTGGGTNGAAATNWCTQAQFGNANCPADFTQVTAFMAFPYESGTGETPTGTSYRLIANVVAAGNAENDKYYNDVVADSPDLTANNPGSNTVVTEVGPPAPTGLVVAGRVYREANGNTVDNGNAIDPGIAGVGVRLVCTSPAYDQTATTLADGSFSFDGLAVGAACTLTETQPANFFNAYTITGGMVSTAGAGTTTNSVITLAALAAGGSSGNEFAETSAIADMAPTLSCAPNPAGLGESVSCTLTCTNNASSTLAATNPLCSIVNAASLPGAPAPSCSSSVPSLAVGSTLTCTISFNMPASSVEVIGGTGANNDDNGGAVQNAGNNGTSVTVLPRQPPPGTVTAVPTLQWPALLAALLGLGAWRRRVR